MDSSAVQRHSDTAPLKLKSVCFPPSITAFSTIPTTFSWEESTLDCRYRANDATRIAVYLGRPSTIPCSLMLSTQSCFIRTLSGGFIAPWLSSIVAAPRSCLIGSAKRILVVSFHPPIGYGSWHSKTMGLILLVGLIPVR